MKFNRPAKGGQRTFIVPVVFFALIFSWFLFFQQPAPIKLDPNYGTLRKASSVSPVAIATFLCGLDKPEKDARVDDDFYFVAARVLTYQLLHDSRTRCNRSIPFLVLVTDDVSPEKRQRLTADGATVLPVDDVRLPGWIKTGVTRWKDQFTKPRLLEMVEYERVLFIDADTLLTRPIDAIFDDLSARLPSTTLPHRRDYIKADEAPLPAQYLFAARSDNAMTGEREHPFPPPPTPVFSAGIWLAAPSRELFAYLLSVMTHRGRFNAHTMEQSLLNYAFRREGAMPWMELDFTWSAT